MRVVRRALSAALHLGCNPKQCDAVSVCATACRPVQRMQNLLMSNPPGAVALAKAIIKQPGPPMDKATICNEFIQRQLYAEATSFALEALADDVPDEGPMQARIHFRLPCVCFAAVLHTVCACAALGNGMLVASVMQACGR